MEEIVVYHAKYAQRLPRDPVISGKKRVSLAASGCRGIA